MQRNKKGDLKQCFYNLKAFSLGAKQGLSQLRLSSFKGLIGLNFLTSIPTHFTWTSPYFICYFCFSLNQKIKHNSAQMDSLSLRLGAVTNLVMVEFNF